MIRTISSAQFDEFEGAMRGVQGRYLLVDRSRMTWDISVLDLAGVALMDGRNGAACLYQGACRPGSFGLLVPVAQLEQLMVNGSPLQHDAIAWLPPSGEFNAPSASGFQWVGVTIDERCVQRWLDCGLVGPQTMGLRIGRAHAAPLHRVVDMVRSAMEVAANDPQALQCESQRESLRQQLLDATLGIMQSLDPVRAPTGGRPRIGRAEVLKRVLGFIDEFIDQPIQVGDFCTRADVSVATLQNIFSEQFGMSPHHYLMLRRLHAIHQAIRNAGTADTVSSICARFGVWDFGRFASQYRRYFGVAPSKALAQRHAGPM